MCHYHHLTLVEREKNMFFHAQDNSVSAIAKLFAKTIDISRVTADYSSAKFEIHIQNGTAARLSHFGFPCNEDVSIV